MIWCTMTLMFWCDVFVMISSLLYCQYLALFCGTLVLYRGLSESKNTRPLRRDMRCLLRVRSLNNAPNCTIIETLNSQKTLQFFVALLYALSCKCGPCAPWVYLMTSSNGTIFCVTGYLCGEFTGHRWIPLTRASDAELWWFLWSAPEQTVE